MLKQHFDKLSVTKNYTSKSNNLRSNSILGFISLSLSNFSCGVKAYFFILLLWIISQNTQRRRGGFLGLYFLATNARIFLDMGCESEFSGMAVFFYVLVAQLKYTNTAQEPDFELSKFCIFKL